MINKNSLIASGALLGFTYFLISLESKGMKNIIFRCGKFNPGGVISYLKSPFFQTYLWLYPELWKNNWVITTLMGAFSGYLIGLISESVL